MWTHQGLSLSQFSIRLVKPAAFVAERGAAWRTVMAIGLSSVRTGSWHSCGRARRQQVRRIVSSCGVSNTVGSEHPCHDGPASASDQSRYRRPAGSRLQKRSALRHRPWLAQHGPTIDGTASKKRTTLSALRSGSLHLAGEDCVSQDSEA